VKKSKPESVEATESKFLNLGEKPKWSRPSHKIERNLEAQKKSKTSL
jgi:biotin synthase